MSEQNPGWIPQHPPRSYWVVPGPFLVGGHPCGVSGSKRLLEFLSAGIDTFISLQPAGERGKADYSRALYRAAATLHRTVHFSRRPIPVTGVLAATNVRDIEHNRQASC